MIRKAFINKEVLAFASILTFLFVNLNTGISSQAFGAAKKNYAKKEVGFGQYKIKYGDTLSKIAARFGVKASYLAKLNGLKTNSTLVSGTYLKVPSNGKNSNDSKAGKDSKIKKISRVSKYKRPLYYQIKSGDTLSKIAKKFRMSIKTLARINKIKVNSVLRSGRKLRIAGSYAVRKTGQPKFHEECSWHLVNENIKVLLPFNYKVPDVETKIFTEDDFIIKLFAKDFSPGKAVYMEILPGKEQKFSSDTDFIANYNEISIIINRQDWGFRCIFPIPADEEPGKSMLVVKSVVKGNEKQHEYSISVKEKDYPTVIWKRYLGNFDRKIKITDEQRKKWQKIAEKRQEWIEGCSKKIQESFSVVSANKLKNVFAHPREHHLVTSQFFTQRKFVNYFRKDGKIQYEKPFIRSHRGLDLAGNVGAPIHAMADGKVLIARQMYYEGNYTIIDHGNNIFTGYMHQSKMLIKEGDEVKAGQIIGKVGATGKVTGPHLHISLWINGFPVDPMSLLCLPFRE